MTTSSIPSRYTAVLICLAALFFLSIFAGCKKQEEAQAPQAPSTPAIDAASLYAGACAGCHGEKGQGGVTAPGFSRAEYTYGKNAEAVRESIVKGRPNGMPGFGERFADDELTALTDYVLGM